MIDEEIAQELDAFYRLAEIQPGDITIRDCMERWGGSDTIWRQRFMAGKVPPGWEALQVRGNNYHDCWVMRRKSANP